MYPTHTHQAQQGLIDGYGEPGEPDAVLTFLAVVESLAWLDSMADVERLAELHVWTPETVRRRFEYRTPGLWALGVRMYRRDVPWPVPDDPSHAGCKTWIVLDPGPGPSPMSPILTDADAADRNARLVSLFDRALSNRAMTNPTGTG